MKQSWNIAGRQVGAGHPLFVVAEIGLNHGGSLDRALALVDAAAAAGASAVKLQALWAHDLVAAHCPAPAHVETDSLRSFFARFELPAADYATIAARVRSHGMALAATPFSIECVDLLEGIGLDIYKIASGDLTYHALIERCARTGKPLMVSTGMATITDVSRAVTVAANAGNRQLALLHCVSAYPVPNGEENLRAITTLAATFGTLAGLSDHSAIPGLSVPVAMALGATIYERHLVLEGDDDALDGAVSSTGAEFAALIAAAAKTQAALGNGRKVCQPAEAANVVPSRRALRAARPLRSGDVIGAADIAVLRPADGLDPSHLHALIGTRLVRDVAEGLPFMPVDLFCKEAV